jgi:superfamily II DNA/RNA helicase
LKLQQFFITVQDSDAKVQTLNDMYITTTPKILVYCSEDNIESYRDIYWPYDVDTRVVYLVRSSARHRSIFPDLSLQSEAMTEQERRQSLTGFAKGYKYVLFTTDDLSATIRTGAAVAVNYDFPPDYDTYRRRMIGKDIIVNFITPEDRHTFDDVKKKLADEFEGPDVEIQESSNEEIG